MSSKNGGASQVWDIGHLQGPHNAQAGTEGGHGHLADACTGTGVVAGQFQRTLAPNPGLGIPSASSGQAWEKGVKMSPA
ncbi:MAG: hypothetical protein ACE5LU_17835 [Anaerolineae bacterium]